MQLCVQITQTYVQGMTPGHTVLSSRLTAAWQLRVTSWDGNHEYRAEGTDEPSNGLSPIYDHPLESLVMCHSCWLTKNPTARASASVLQSSLYLRDQTSGSALPPLLIFHLPSDYTPQPFLQILSLDLRIDVHGIAFSLQSHTTLLFFVFVSTACIFGHLACLVPLLVAEVSLAFAQQHFPVARECEDVYRSYGLCA